MGETYAAIVRALQARLTASSQNNHGRDGQHAFGPCPVCKIHVCLTHHQH